MSTTITLADPVTTTTELTDPTRQPIAGTEILGHGLNPFGDLKTAVGVIFDTQGTEQAVVIDDVTYYCGDAIRAFKDTSGNDSETSFMTREEYQAGMKVSIGVEGKYGAFSGRFSATFGYDYDTLLENAGALKTSAITLWTLRLEQNKRKPTADFVAAVDGLPAQFRGNEARYYHFFQTYGGFVVTEVTVGGSLEYALLVQTSHVESSSALKDQVGAEYGSMFKGSASHEQFEKIKKSSEYSQRRLSTMGGDPTLFTGVDLRDPKDWSSTVQKWAQSIAKSPKVVLLKVEPINAFVGDAKNDEVAKALDKYLQGSAMVEASWAGSTFSVSGDRVNDPATGENASGPTLRVMILDRKSLQKTETRFPAPDPGSPEQAFQDYWSGVHAVLAAAPPGDNMLLLATERWPRDRSYFPSSDVKQDLLDHGAGEATLNRWETLSRNALRCSVAGLSYVLAGAVGRNHGSDALAAGFGKPGVNLIPTARVSVLLPHNNDGRVRLVIDDKPRQDAKTDFYVIQNWTDAPRPVLAADPAGPRALLKADDPARPEQYWYLYPSDERYGVHPYALVNYLTCGNVAGKVGGGGDVAAEAEVTRFQEPLQDDVLWEIRGTDGKANMLLLYYRDQNWNLMNWGGQARTGLWFKDGMWWQRIKHTL